MFQGSLDHPWGLAYQISRSNPWVLEGQSLQEILCPLAILVDLVPPKHRFQHQRCHQQLPWNLVPLDCQLFPGSHVFPEAQESQAVPSPHELQGILEILGDGLTLDFQALLCFRECQACLESQGGPELP